MATLWIRAIAIVLAATLLSSVVAYYLGAFGPTREKLVVSTTTSLYDTGLLDVIEERFEELYRIDLQFISAGTGLAIRQAERGDVDLILVHSPPEELRFLEAGHGVCRKIIAYNFFIIVGPLEDPAGVRGSTPSEAMERIASAGERGIAVWVSRGDGSGTHMKEQMLWKAIGLDYTSLKGKPWYLEAGAGMGKTLQVAEEFSAYTLADIGTYLKYLSDRLVTLQELVAPGRELLNVYSVIALNPETHPSANIRGALTFIQFLTSEEGQRTIGDYGQARYGRSLFNPAVKLLRDRSDPALVQWIAESAYFGGSECPEPYRGGHQELYG